MLGALLSFLSAAFFGFNAVMMRRGVLTGSALQGLSFTLPLGALFFGLASLVLMIWSNLKMHQSIRQIRKLMQIGSEN